MNLKKKGWLKEFLNKKSEFYSSADKIKEFFKGQHPDQALYAMIQPTGIMYGYPVGLKEDSIESSNGQENIKLLLIESLLDSYLLIKIGELGKNMDFASVITKFAEELAQYYNSVFPDVHTSATSLFSRKKSCEEVIEIILEKRLKSRSSSTNFWKGFFNNSMLFLDVYFFRYWAQAGHDQLIVDYIKSQKQDIQISVVKVMSAAAHSNKSIEPEEEKLFLYFIDSQNFSSDQKKVCKDFFKNGVLIEELPVPIDNSWILKKYFTELAILTTWADMNLENIELNFLKEFNKKMDLSEDDFTNSFVAVEGFVLEYWKELEKLQSHQEYIKVSEKYIAQLGSIIGKFEDRLTGEIKSRGKLTKLIHKANTENLSDDEKEYIRLELITCIETLPTLDIISLPKRFLTLDNLMKILPKNIFKNV